MFFQMNVKYAEALKKYGDASIDAAGKTELKKKFREVFGFKSDDTFHLLVTKKSRNPTPDQTAWLIEHINQYWDHYASVDKETA